MSLLKRIFEPGEETAFHRIEGIVRVSYSANSALNDIIKGQRDLSAIRALEKSAGSEHFNISRAITSGAIAPNLIDDMILLATKEEDITEALFKLSRQMLRYKIPSKKNDAYVRKCLTSFNDFAEDALSLLSKMHEASDMNTIRSSRTKIHEIENKADEVRDRLLDFAYNTKMEFKEFYHIIHLAYTYDEVLDTCEDAADLFMSMMLSITT